jgi:hypothetical protein
MWKMRECCDTELGEEHEADCYTHHFRAKEPKEQNTDKNTGRGEIGRYWIVLGAWRKGQS